MLVDRAPQVPQPAVDPDEHLVEVPLVAGARAPPAQLVGLGLPELGAPPPDRLVTHRDTAYEHQLPDSRKLGGNLKYSHTQWLMISTG